MLGVGGVVIAFLSLTVLPFDSVSTQAQIIQDLRARFDSASESIYVEWTTPPSSIGAYLFNVRYRLTNRPGFDSSWKYARTQNNYVRLDLRDIQNGDEIEAQVNVEHGGRVVEPWSQSLLITVTKRIVIGGVPVDEDDLMPPVDFIASILSPTSARLEWTDVGGNKPGLYYIINIKQLTAQSGGGLPRQQVRTEANNFALGNLTPGERYEMTIRSATSPQHISRTATIVEITMPKKEEYFEVQNLVISSHFESKNRGAVNLTWEVPENMRHKIKSYEIQYAESGSQNWHRLPVSGSFTSASLTDLKSDTEYLLKIKTALDQDIITESGQFRFRTPEAVINPIRRVDVVYAHDTNSVRLQWILESHIEPREVIGYDIYLSEDKEKPQNEWRHITVRGSESSVSLNDLLEATVYFVRIDVRLRSGAHIRSPNLYRFRTTSRAQSARTTQQSSSLQYRNVGMGKVSLTWTYPDALRPYVTGSTVMFTDRKELPYDQWARRTMNGQQNSIILTGLRPSARYFIQVVPHVQSDHFISPTIEMFEIRTERNQQNSVIERPRQASQVHENQRNNRITSNTGNQLGTADSSAESGIRLKSCNPDAIQPECPINHRCIQKIGNPQEGWCVPDILRQSILSS
ncbi:hypothetical protein AB6A40_000036 [Gnathostoma spinigerum]|uniref:Fibronectin type-III domain-containing protein n=1 Tax=Gnathostoma spinigerum TaxID=75299 RepID=A0ABD6EA31_9BILA